MPYLILKRSIRMYVLRLHRIQILPIHEVLSILLLDVCIHKYEYQYQCMHGKNIEHVVIINFLIIILA